MSCEERANKLRGGPCGCSQGLSGQKLRDRWRALVKAARSGSGKCGNMPLTAPLRAKILEIADLPVLKAGQ